MIPGMRQKEQKERKAMNHGIFPAVICVPRWSHQSQSHAVLHMHAISAAAVTLPIEHGVHRTKRVCTLCFWMFIQEPGIFSLNSTKSISVA